MFWKPFSSPSGKGSLEDVLERANSQLELAAKQDVPAKALRLAREAKLLLKDAEKIFHSKKVQDQALKDSIANAYHEHGKLLDELGYHDKAQKSRLKAEEWGYLNERDLHVKSSLPDFADGSIDRLTPDAAPEKLQNLPVAVIELPVVESHIQDMNPAEIKSSVRRPIFDRNVTAPATKYILPDIGERITSTPQLAYCLSLLRPSLVEGIDNAEFVWSQARINDLDEQERLQTMGTELVVAFIREDLKKPDVVAEVVSLATVLDKTDFRKLLQAFVNGIKKSLLLQIHLLDGLAQLIRNASPGFFDADDLVKILELLNARLKETHKQSAKNIYQLTLTISRVLDSMVENHVEGLSRESLHEPLSEYLKELQKSSNSYLIFQAAYASQALLYIRNDEPVLQAALRRTGKVVRGVSGMVRALKALDIDGFIQGLQSIQGSLADAGNAIKLVGEAYSYAKTLAEGGNGLLERLKEGLSFSVKSAWYPALRVLDRLLQEGQFTEFERLIRDTPCQRDPAFQWGVCQRLGELATNSAWDANTRRSAVAFLGEMYKDDETWGQQTSVKQWILAVLYQISDQSNDDLASQVQTLMEELKTNGSADKQLLYQNSKNPVPFPMTATLPPQDSPLLMYIQNKPDVDTPLRRLQRDRLKNQDTDLYISPRAKNSTRAKQDFDLTSKVQEFLKSEKKVFLLLGDSGSGKSTFNRALEVSLWDDYKVGQPIPLFIYLAAIEKPEYDLINKQLQRYDFSEDQIKELKRYHEFIVICDGYDECQQIKNLYVSNNLNRPGEWRVQMIITCRSEYAGIDYVGFFQPSDINDRRRPELYQEAVMMPFNKDQINDYIDRYVLTRKPLWEKNDYQRALKEIPNLQDLLKNPFLLRIALEVLPDVLDKGGNFSTARITRVGLYDGFMTQWLERGKRRLRDMELSPSDKEALTILSQLGFSLQGSAFLKDLSAAVYDNQFGNPAIDYSEPRDLKTWKEQFFAANEGNGLLLKAMPLVCSGTLYKYIHKSVLEYGVTLSVFDPNSNSEVIEPEELEPTSSRRMSVSSALSFETEETERTPKKSISTAEQSLLDSPLGRRSFVGEPSVMQFLAERIQQQPTFKDQLLSIVERSKTDKTTRIAAANAITILVRAGHQFNGADLRGAKIPGADLSYGVFDSAQMQGSDLRKVNLRNAWLRQANLDGANMAGVQFAEFPMLEEDSDTQSWAYSPDGKTFAVGTWSGDISLYETSGWNRIRTLSGHSDAVVQLRFSAESDQIVSGCLDEIVKLWNVESGDCIHTFQGHGDSITVVAFSPDGSQTASGSADKTVRLWDVDSGECIHTLQGHAKHISSVLFSPKGRQIASGSLDSTVRLWEVETGKCLHILEGHKKKVTCIAYSPQGKHIASGSGDSTVRIWDIDTGDLVYTLEGHSNGISSIAYSPKGDRIASSSEDTTVRLWNADNGGCVDTLQGHKGVVSYVTYSPNGHYIASSSEDRSVRLWDSEAGDCIETLLGHSNTVSSVIFSPKGNQIAFGGNVKTIQISNIGSAESLASFQSHSRDVTCVVSSPKGDQIASGSRDGTVCLWCVNTGRCVKIFKCHEDGVQSIAYSPNGGQIACGEYNGAVRLLDIETGDCVHTLLGHGSTVHLVVYSPKGDRIASGSEDGTARLWDVEVGDCINMLSDNYIQEIFFTATGYPRARKGFDDEIMLRDIHTGDCVYTFHHEQCFSFINSPKGDSIASASRAGTVKIWNNNTGECVKTFDHDGVFVIMYSPNGDQVASGGFDGTVRLWSVESGDCSHILEGHSEFITRVEYSPKGDLIATASYDMTVRLWSVDSGECLATISDFWKDVRCVEWTNASEGLRLVTGSDDKSVRCWKIVKKGDGYQTTLCWSSLHEQLTATGTSLDDTQGLTQLNSRLLSQRGALTTTSP